MNKDRLIGIIMIGLIIIIILMYFFNSTNEKKIENENEELKSMLEREREVSEENPSTSTEDSNNSEEDTSIENENKDEEKTEINVNDAGKLISTELDTYDKFIEEFITTLNIYDDQETKNELLYSMSNEEVQAYLKENYYILESSEQTEDDDNHGTHAEGDFEPLEMDMELSSIQSYYTYTNNEIQVVTLYKMNTTAGEEKFSGNYILKGSLTNDNGEIKFNTIDSIVSINDPNAEELYNITSEE